MIILCCFGGTTIFGNIHMTTWNMGVHLPHDKWLGKYSSPMDPMGIYIIFYTSTSWDLQNSPAFPRNCRISFITRLSGQNSTPLLCYRIIFHPSSKTLYIDLGGPPDGHKNLENVMRQYPCDTEKNKTVMPCVLETSPRMVFEMLGDPKKPCF